MRIGLTITALFAATPVVIAAQASRTPTLAANSPPEIPLRAGLTIVKAIEMTTGDGELILRVNSVDAEGVHITYSGEFLRVNTDNPLGALLGGSGKNASRSTEQLRIRGSRTIRRVDAESARHYQSLFANNQPQVFPGSTSLGTSALVLNELKTRGQAEFSCQCASGLEGALGNIAGALGSMLGESGSKEGSSLGHLAKLSGTLRRVEAKPVPIAVLVNNVRVQLPTIHAKGKLGDEDGDFYFLDDAQNPVALRGRVGPQSLQVIKISFPSATATREIATALEKVGRVDVYGIYFDLGSATIKPESEAVLKEIAEVLAANADWKLSVEGHTDNIGSGASNLDLSRRRAAAVKDALVARYGIRGERLTTAGFGASRPKETNSTLEGRARNRRVELVRQVNPAR
jgi:outer membrane protein OmpA-like peptidoglycan-associated protein